MQIPGNMTAPRMKLAEGEQVIHTQPGLRRKGIFGSRFGELYVTNQRVAFVKAIVRTGLVSLAFEAIRVNPMLAFSRGSVRAEKVQLKKQTALVLSSGEQQERIVMDEAAIDRLLPLITQA